MDSDRPARVGVIFVNWNGWQHTVAACRSLEPSTHKAIEIIIVDNASSDDSLTQLRAALAHAHIVANPVNSGFAGACNAGIRHAVQLGCDYVFLLNNDALAESDTIARLVAASKAKNDDALLGSVLIYLSSGEYQFLGSRSGKLIQEPHFFSAKADAQLLKQEFIETDFIVGAAFFLPVKLLDRIGLFDERFFLNYEETDLCYRARKLGIPCFVVPSSVVRHHGNATMGPYTAPLQAYFMTRNGLLFAEKHATGEQRRYLYLKNLYWEIRRAWKAGRFLDSPTRARARAFWDYAWRRFGDCPDVIRREDAAYRGIPYRPSSASQSK